MLARAVTTALKLGGACRTPAGRRVLSTTAPFGCWFVATDLNIPHPDKAAGGGVGEDAVSSSRFLLGVADGVGGWAESGIDAGMYSRELISKSVEAAEGKVPPFGLEEVATAGYKDTHATGSSTLCLVAPGAGMTADTFNLGDSGWMQLRLGAGNIFGKEWAKHHKAMWGVVARSKEQTHYFNCPFQLGTGSVDSPAHADKSSVSVLPGDVMLLATDGLLDNLFDTDVTHVASRIDFEPCVAAVVLAKAGRLTPSGPGKTEPAATAAALTACQATVRSFAAALAVKAHEVGADARARSPFQVAAHKHGYEYSGGKLDDVGLAVGLVLPVRR